MTSTKLNQNALKQNLEIKPKALYIQVKHKQT